MLRGISLSLLLHLGILLVVAFGFPILFDRQTVYEPTALTVEVVPIKQITNLPSEKKPVRKEKPAPSAKPKVRKPVPKTKLPEPEPQPKPEPKPEPKTEPVPPPEAKPSEPEPEEKPEPKPEPAPKEDKPDDFAVLMSKLQQEELAENDETPAAEPAPDRTTSRSDNYNPSVPLSISEKDAIRSQFIKCWRMPAGAKNDYTLAVRLRVLVKPDGAVSQVGLVPEQQGRYQSDRFFRAAVDSAVRAVHQCSPLQNLPPDKYETWKDMELNFDPREMLY